MPEFKVDENIELRVPDESHTEELTALIRASLPHLKPWLIWAVDEYDAECARTFIRQNLQDISEDKRMTFSIFYRGKIAGGIGFVHFDREKRRTEIGYWIDSALQGKGVITKCCRALIDHAFDRENMERIEIRASSANLRSRAVAERLSFTLDRIDKGVHPMPGDKFDDLAIYSITRKVWENIRGSV